MCGFVGFIGGGDTQRDQGVLQSMTDAIRHRGPDDADYYADGEISLGFRRLSIIDLEGGRQPILNEDGTKVLMFNGEIYNYRPLREELLQKGHKFTTKTDSEVLLHGYEEYGPDLLNKLRGMFAFIIWDKEKKELFGARDFFGIKPFYYALMGRTLLFGSEIKSFLHHPHFKKELNEKALESYLSFQYSPGPETFFKNVYKMPPAHYFTYKDGKMDITRYWLPTFNAEEDKPLEYWVDEIEKPVILTFDDGYNDNYSELFPLLQKYETKATVFVITNNLSYNPNFMTWEQAKEMADSGLVDIQSHTVTHPHLNAISREQQIDELQGSYEAILEHIGRPPTVLCYPYGDFNTDTQDIGRGFYQCGIMMNGGDYTTGTNTFVIPRHYVPRYTTLGTFAYLVD